MGTQLPLPKRGQSPSNFRSMSNVPKQLHGSRIEIPLGMEVGLGPGQIVLDGDPAPLPKKRCIAPQIFGPCLLWPNGWVDQDTTWYDGRPRWGQHCVRCGLRTQLHPPQGAKPPHFGPCLVCCGQRAGWIKMPLGTKVGLGPGRIVLHADAAPPPKRGTAPQFLVPCLLWPNGCPSQLLLSACLIMF